MYDIDLMLLSRSLDYFKTKGFKYQKAPMLVDKDIIDLTLPSYRTAKQHEGSGLYYVGSAEQSFYQLLKDNEDNLNGNYLLLTPCEREEIEDDTHLSIFLKLELISSLHETTPYEMSSLVYSFLLPYIQKYQATSAITKTETGYDIEINGIEVGSYGQREIFGKKIVYGTGLALPRISQALNNRT